MAYDNKRTIRYWCESAAYDLETGKSLLAAGRYPYALFFGHLALEKILKALIVQETGRHAPYTHSLILLAQKTSLEFTDEKMDTLAEFMEFHIEARYPDENKSFYDKCTKKFATRKLAEVEELYIWLTQKLKT